MATASRIIYNFHCVLPAYYCFWLLLITLLNHEKFSSNTSFDAIQKSHSNPIAKHNLLTNINENLVLHLNSSILLIIFRNKIIFSWISEFSWKIPDLWVTLLLTRSSILSKFYSWTFQEICFSYRLVSIMLLVFKI